MSTTQTQVNNKDSFDQEESTSNESLIEKVRSYYVSYLGEDTVSAIESIQKDYPSLNLIITSTSIMSLGPLMMFSQSVKLIIASNVIAGSWAMSGYKALCYLPFVETVGNFTGTLSMECLKILNSTLDKTNSNSEEPQPIKEKEPTPEASKPTSPPVISPEKENLDLFIVHPVLIPTEILAIPSPIEVDEVIQTVKEELIGNFTEVPKEMIDNVLKLQDDFIQDIFNEKPSSSELVIKENSPIKSISPLEIKLPIVEEIHLPFLPQKQTQDNGLFGLFPPHETHEFELFPEKKLELDNKKAYKIILGMPELSSPQAKDISSPENSKNNGLFSLFPTRESPKRAKPGTPPVQIPETDIDESKEKLDGSSLENNKPIPNQEEDRGLFGLFPARESPKKVKLGTPPVQVPETDNDESKENLDDGSSESKPLPKQEEDRGLFGLFPARESPKKVKYITPQPKKSDNGEPEKKRDNGLFGIIKPIPKKEKDRGIFGLFPPRESPKKEPLTEIKNIEIDPNPTLPLEDQVEEKFQITSLKSPQTDKPTSLMPDLSAKVAAKVEDKHDEGVLGIFKLRSKDSDRGLFGLFPPHESPKKDSPIVLDVQTSTISPESEKLVSSGFENNEQDQVETSLSLDSPKKPESILLVPEVKEQEIVNLEEPHYDGLFGIFKPQPKQQEVSGLFGLLPPHESPEKPIPINVETSTLTISPEPEKLVTDLEPSPVADNNDINLVGLVSSPQTSKKPASFSPELEKISPVEDDQVFIQTVSEPNDKHISPRLISSVQSLRSFSPVIPEPSKIKQEEKSPENLKKVASHDDKLIGFFKLPPKENREDEGLFGLIPHHDSPKVEIEDKGLFGLIPSLESPKNTTIEANYQEEAILSQEPVQLDPVIIDEEVSHFTEPSGGKELLQALPQPLPIEYSPEIPTIEPEPSSPKPNDLPELSTITIDHPTLSPLPLEEKLIDTPFTETKEVEKQEDKGLFGMFPPKNEEKAEEVENEDKGLFGLFPPKIEEKPEVEKEDKGLFDMFPPKIEEKPEEIEKKEDEKVIDASPPEVEENPVQVEKQEDKGLFGLFPFKTEEKPEEVEKEDKGLFIMFPPKAEEKVEKEDNGLFGMFPPKIEEKPEEIEKKEEEEVIDGSPPEVEEKPEEVEKQEDKGLFGMFPPKPEEKPKEDRGLFGMFPPKPEEKPKEEKKQENRGFFGGFGQPQPVHKPFGWG